jgi:hypothetical protein
MAICYVSWLNLISDEAGPESKQRGSSMEAIDRWIATADLRRT